MKYYGLGQAITALKIKNSHRFLDKSPVFGLPILGNLPITQLQMQEAFLKSENFILCKTLDSAMALRHNKIEFNAGRYPDMDYAIYEIELDAPIELLFTRLVDTPIDQLEPLVSSNLYYAASIFEDRSKILDIEICLAKKTDIQPRLIACRYFSPINGQEILDIKHDRCFIL